MNWVKGLSAWTSINLVSSKHTIRVKCAILEIYKLVTQNTDTTSTLSTTTLASIKVIRLYQGPLLEYSSHGQTTNPQVNNEQD